MYRRVVLLYSPRDNLHSVLAFGYNSIQRPVIVVSTSIYCFYSSVHVCSPDPPSIPCDITLRDSRRYILNRARKAEATLQRLVGKYWIPPASARNLQQAIIHGTLLYGAEDSWNGTKTMEKNIQLLTNQMGRSSLGVRKTTPIGIVTAESALPPARALLDHRQARFALRLLARPQEGGGQEEILL